MFKKTKLIRSFKKQQDRRNNGYVKDCVFIKNAMLFVALGLNVLDVMNGLKERVMWTCIFFLSSKISNLIVISYQWSVEQLAKRIETATPNNFEKIKSYERVEKSNKVWNNFMILS